jgi:hypothetical protein
MGYPNEGVSADGTGGGTTQTGRSDLRFAFISGAAAGDHTVTGIATGDVLDRVYRADVNCDASAASATAIVSVLAFADDTAEYTITAANTINNAAGTSSADMILIVFWRDRSAAQSETAIA